MGQRSQITCQKDGVVISAYQQWCFGSITLKAIINIVNIMKDKTKEELIEMSKDLKLWKVTEDCRNVKLVEVDFTGDVFKTHTQYLMDNNNGGAVVNLDTMEFMVFGGSEESNVLPLYRQVSVYDYLKTHLRHAKDEPCKTMLEQISDLGLKEKEGSIDYRDYMREYSKWLLDNKMFLADITKVQRGVILKKAKEEYNTVLSNSKVKNKITPAFDHILDVNESIGKYYSTQSKKFLMNAPDYLYIESIPHYIYTNHEDKHYLVLNSKEVDIDAFLLDLFEWKDYIELWAERNITSLGDKA